jgi:hypothetical protein
MWRGLKPVELAGGGTAGGETSDLGRRAQNVDEKICQAKVALLGAAAARDPKAGVLGIGRQLMVDL